MPPTGGLGVGHRPRRDAARRRAVDQGGHPVPDSATGGRCDERPPGVAACDRRRRDGMVLDTWYRYLGLGEPPMPSVDDGLAQAIRHDHVRGVDIRVVDVEIDLDAAPQSTRRTCTCACTSCRTAWCSRARSTSTGRSASWRTSRGPATVRCLVDTFEDVRLHARQTERVLTVHGIDKFPRMTDYVVPSGVRIADAVAVRLGAHLASGTVVMHEGFCNFNAGTLGTAMVEGRISQGRGRRRGLRHRRRRVDPAARCPAAARRW